MRILASCLILFLIGCKSLSPEEETALTAFRAIANNDWEQYQTLTITVADLEMKANKISRWQADSSFAGGVLKPKQQKKQREDFERAVTSGLLEGADFSTLRFVRQSSVELMSGGEVTTFIYNIDLEDDEQLSAQLVLVAWGSFFRVIALDFP